MFLKIQDRVVYEITEEESQKLLKEWIFYTFWKNIDFKDIYVFDFDKRKAAQLIQELQQDYQGSTDSKSLVFWIILIVSAIALYFLVFNDKKENEIVIPTPTEISQTQNNLFDRIEQETQQESSQNNFVIDNNTTLLENNTTISELEWKLLLAESTLSSCESNLSVLELQANFCEVDKRELSSINNVSQLQSSANSDRVIMLTEENLWLISQVQRLTESLAIQKSLNLQENQLFLTTPNFKF